ncbi:uncharacterized protein C10orf143 homolog isoform X1 [Pan paniscus]|uniref:uncharacterized protein C10orf143 homolog isoform X1 n=1 Tax=Pan paniscus TaxID=9597 RepID=UPI0004F00108
MLSLEPHGCSCEGRSDKQRYAGTSLRSNDLGQTDNAHSNPIVSEDSGLCYSCLRSSPWCSRASRGVPPLRLLIGSRGPCAEGGVVRGPRPGLRGREGLTLGLHGQLSARPLATAEGGGSAGSGGRETGMQEIRSQWARAWLPPGECLCPGVLGPRGPGASIKRLSPSTKARKWPGEAKYRDFSEWWKELSPALPKMYCRGIYSCSHLCHVRHKPLLQPPQLLRSWNSLTLCCSYCLRYTFPPPKILLLLRGPPEIPVLCEAFFRPLTRDILAIPRIIRRCKLEKRRSQFWF